jgi:hypothetical protein
MRARSAGLLALLRLPFLTLLMLTLLTLTLLTGRGSAQGSGYERTFAESKTTVEKVLKQMQPSLAGRLPVLDGFALAGDHPLDRYQRGFFQSSVQVSATASGGSVVHVTTKVTAWYPDPIPSRSGYQLLTSNGRLEVDLLDELAAELKSSGAGETTIPQRAPATEVPTTAPSTSPITQPSRVVQPQITETQTTQNHTAQNQATQNHATQAQATQPQTTQPRTTQRQPAQAQTSQSQTSQSQTARQVQPQTQVADNVPPAPTTPLPQTGGTFQSSLTHGLAAAEAAATPAAPPPVDADRAGLKAEADSLEEILKNQSHPKNLVAVKKSGTPVVATASLTAKTLFLADAHDEFEMLDFNPDWVHVRISGLSRGWIWRNSLEMPDGVPDLDTHAGAAPGPTADELFRVSREDTAQFPGDWEPLRNKNVKIISVQKTDESAQDGGSKLKLEFAKSMLGKSYADLAKKDVANKTDSVAGIVLIFDSADGGMIAATMATLQQWKAGTLSDSALWHQCYFDPPELSGSAGQAASQ